MDETGPGGRGDDENENTTRCLCFPVSRRLLLLCSRINANILFLNLTPYNELSHLNFCL